MEATDKSIILFSDIAEDEISEFQLFLFGQTVPVLETGEKCAWRHDYERFKEGKIKGGQLMPHEIVKEFIGVNDKIVLFYSGMSGVAAATALTMLAEQWAKAE